MVLDMMSVVLKVMCVVPTVSSLGSVTGCMWLSIGVASKHEFPFSFCWALGNVNTAGLGVRIE